MTFPSRVRDFQSFTLVITNSGGTIQHATRSQFGAAVDPVFRQHILGSSQSFANTPYITSGVGFVNGWGVSNADKSLIYADTPDQGSTKNCHGIAHLCYWDAGGVTPLLDWRYVSINVNGVTRVRPEIRLTNPLTGGGINVDTTTIASGKAVGIKVIGFVRP